MYVNTAVQAYLVHTGPRRGYDFLELELQMVVSFPIGAGKRIYPLQKQEVLLTTDMSLQHH